MDIILTYLLFPVLCLLLFIGTGLLLLKYLGNNKSYSLESIVFGTVIGYVVLNLVAYFFLILHISFWIIPFGIALLIYLNKDIFNKIKINKTISRLDLISIAVFMIGVIFQLLVIAPSGITKNGDLLFWSSHGHDATWHIAVMNKIAEGFPLENPIFSLERLYNYHYFFNILPAIFMKNFNLSEIEMYFRLFPLLFSILLGSTAYYLGKKVGKSQTAGIWNMFFVYFVGSFGYIATLIKDGIVGGESIFWASQVHSSIGNPPQIISNFLVLSFLYFIFDYFNTKRKSDFIFCVLIASVLPVFKVYAAVIVFLSLGVIAIIRLITVKNFDIFVMTFISALFAAVLYLPNTLSSASFLIIEPWWYIRTMIVSEGRLNWIDHELRRQTFLAHNNYLRVIQLELIAFVIFIVGNLGTRIVGLTYFIKNIKKFFVDNFYALLTMIATFSVVLPLLFLQKGVVSNTAQFLQYFLLTFGIAASISIDELLKKVKQSQAKAVIVLILIFISAPTQIGLLFDFYQRPAFAKVSKLELEALNFTKMNSADSDVIIVPSYDPHTNTDEETPPIWDWFDTSYVSAFAKRSVYFADYEQLDIMGYDFNERKDLVEKLFNTNSPSEFDTLFKKSGSSILYFPKMMRPDVFLPMTSLEKKYENDEVEIWSY